MGSQKPGVEWEMMNVEPRKAYLESSTDERFRSWHLQNAPRVKEPVFGHEVEEELQFQCGMNNLHCPFLPSHFPLYTLNLPTLELEAA